MDGDNTPLNPNMGDEIARRVAANRLRELREWMERIEGSVETASLYEIEADLQLVGVICRTTSIQILRVLKASGLLRGAAGRMFARDEIGEMRERQGPDPDDNRDGFIPPFNQNDDE